MRAWPSWISDFDLRHEGSAVLESMVTQEKMLRNVISLCALSQSKGDGQTHKEGTDFRPSALDRVWC